LKSSVLLTCIRSWVVTDRRLIERSRHKQKSHAAAVVQALPRRAVGAYHSWVLTTKEGSFASKSATVAFVHGYCPDGKCTRNRATMLLEGTKIGAFVTQYEFQRLAQGAPQRQ
jgi:hypothetical protein